MTRGKRAEEREIRTRDPEAFGGTGPDGSEVMQRRLDSLGSIRSWKSGEGLKNLLYKPPVDRNSDDDVHREGNRKTHRQIFCWIGFRKCIFE